MAMGRTNDSGVMLFGMGSTDENILRSLSNYKIEVSRTPYQISNSTFVSLFHAHPTSLSIYCRSKRIVLKSMF